MRFKADGPAIPDILLEARDAGNVVFLCGAGVSIPAGMPGFVELTQHVIDELDPPQDSEIRQALGTVSVLGETSPTVPAWCRPSLDQLFQLLHQEYGRDQVARIVWKRLRSVEPVRAREHDIVARISANAEGHPQIVTTNFDHLFESALADGKPSIYEPPMYPDLRHGVPATGITYLHGRLADTESDTHDYILSSADLGRAYLAEGWATAFVRQLLQRCTVVLLGYRAEDPPLKYLLQGLDSAGRQTGNSLFAFDEGHRDEVEAKWSDRGVQVIPYGNTHETLWETLGAWADRADNPTSWRSAVAGLSAHGPRALAPHERGMVAHLVRCAIGAKEFAERKPGAPAEWLCVFDVSCRYAKPSHGFREGTTAFDPLETYGLDDDPPRPAEDKQQRGWPGDDLIRWRRGDDSVDHWRRLTAVSWPRSEPMPPRLFQLARWLALRIDDPDVAWWVAKQPALHPELHRMLKSAVEESPHLDDHARRGWMILFEALETGSEHAVDMECIAVRQRIKKQGWTSAGIRAFEAATEPVFTIKGGYGNQDARPPSRDWSTVKWTNVAHLAIHFPAHMWDAPNPPDAALPSIYAALERNLMRASERIREVEWTSFHLSTFRSEDGGDAKHGSNGPDAYVDRFRDLLDRLSKSRLDRLRKRIDLWPDPDPHIFEKLRLYVWNKPELFSAVEVVERILALPDDAFWRSDQQRELMFLLSGRWAGFSAEGRDAVGRRILDGPPTRDDEDEVEATYAARRQRTAAMRFGWLVQAGCGFSDGLVAEWTVLKNGFGEWQDSWIAGAVAASEVVSGSVRTDEDTSVLEGVPIEGIAQAALTHSGRAWNTFVEKRPFNGLVKSYPVRAVLALAAAARRREFPEVLWKAAIRDWPDNAPRRATRALHGRLRRLPPETVFAMRGTVADWLGTRFPKAAVDDRVLAHEVFDHVVACLAGAGSAPTDSPLREPTIHGTRVQASRRTYGHAINGPTGKATEGLLKVLAARNPGESMGLPDDFKARVNRLLAAPGEGADHVICVLSNRIGWLNHVDSEWVSARMIPWFRLDRCRSEPAWSGILWNRWGRIQAVFRAIKASFLALPTRMHTWASTQEIEQY